jgi:hypothetical protein
MELFDQLLEGHVLVLVRADRLAADALDQFEERGIAGEIDAQRQRVDEEPDEGLGLRDAAARERRADHQVVLAADPAQPRAEGGEQRHVERGSGLPPQGLQRTRGFPAQVHPLRCAPMGPGRRPGAIRGQVQHGRRAGERLLPVGELPVAHAAVEPLPLPGGVVRVLDL